MKKYELTGVTKTPEKITGRIVFSSRDHAERDASVTAAEKTIRESNPNGTFQHVIHDGLLWADFVFLIPKPTP